MANPFQMTILTQTPEYRLFSPALLQKNNNKEMKIPSDYQEGYKKALQIDGERATNYVAHTTIGDPLADELVDDLSHLEHNQSAELLKTALSADSSRIG